ncbi:MAG: hypothetical protein WDW38_009954 [Sanguina aurantia]
MGPGINVAFIAVIVALCLSNSNADGVIQAADSQPKISNERVVFQLEQGDVEFAFFPEVAPVTANHIFNLVALGCYTTNHFFRVDKNFVAQNADVVSGRLSPLNEQQKEFASKNVPLEVKAGVKHHEGIVSMARGGSRDSGGSSFFIMYGSAPHLDMEYGIFGRVTKGMDVIHSLEKLPTRTEGIFVMPLARITIVNSYWYNSARPHHLALPQLDGADCDGTLTALQLRYSSQAEELQRVRRKCLPS